MGSQVVPAVADQVTVFAAASMKTALEEIADGFTQATGSDCDFVCCRIVGFGATN